MGHDFLDSIADKPFYRLIQQKYKGKVAQRSGVSYMNHIQEGAYILQLIYGNNEDLIEAFCLHPIFQSDKLLSQLFSDSSSELSLISPHAIILGMEYRRVAGNYTIKNKIKSFNSIEIGPLDKVHKMLVADKIQNKKDFMKYLYLKHDRPSYHKVSEHVIQYFDSWLNCLSVSQEMYKEIVEQVEQNLKLIVLDDINNC
ncbi:hypothetical protein TUMEXPCC7403_20700 [Tumidithrix helvetica PCC 7403]|uniref:hypothetical protein n=1 Tax=Tumidithrix helvetica TaxID=3457545 RepID=UPI003C83618A